MVKNEQLRKLIFIELAVWLIIALGIVVTIRHYRIKHIKSQVTYQIFMPDVDGLIVGSPVKFMGVEIGYINQINIVGHDVYLKFLINKKDLKLPQGVIATTEFSGLGGSKSLELYPPTPETIASNKIIYVQAPTRLRDIFILLKEMVDKINAIAYKAAAFGEKAEDIHPKSDIQIKEMQDNLDSIDKWSNTFTENIDKKFNKKHNNEVKDNGIGEN